MLGKEKNIHTFIGCDSGYGQAGIVLFGAPFDGTTSFRPGTRFASAAMRAESFGLETFSPYLNRDLEDIAAFDAGDLDFPFGNSARVLDAIESAAATILGDGKIPCMIGGEHLVTLGAVRAAAAKYSDLHIIHFDAHADLRDDYIGEKLSHATVMRRCWELVGDGRIHQFGIRSGERSEFDWGARHVSTRRFDFEGLGSTVKALKGRPVYFTLDLDVLDPSIFPGTGTPEAGGVTFKELLSAVQALEGLDIVGFDVNELSPQYDLSGASTATACKILRELLLIVSARSSA
ncbi:MAG: agmatinase [Oscillospiraceae bacterium]|jgi:agmatinase|nr:agmatinase [Oscillospiraceae bacterium]